MSYQWLIIDGNNLLHADPEFGALLHRDFNAARRGLVAKLERVSGSIADRVTVVFDGSSGPLAEGYENAGIEVRFSDSGYTADATIERIIFDAAKPGDITVVTSDRAERDTVEGRGAQGLSCRMFLANFKEDSGNLNRQVRQLKKPKGLNTLGDHFPDIDSPET